MLSFLSTLRNNFSPLRAPNFRLYLSGQAVSLVGTWLQSTAQGWLVWQLTGSEAALGIVNMLNTLPILLLGPWAGVWADRLDRRKLLIGTQIAAMFLAFILAFLVQTKSVQIWHVYFLSLMLGIVNTLDLPTQQAFLGDLSGMGEVRKAINLNAMLLQISRIIGPAFAGFLIARLGNAPAFWLNGISFLAVVLSLLGVRSSQKSRPSANVSPLRQVWEAVKFIRTQPRLMDVFFFAELVTFLLFPIVFNLMPSIADKILGGDAQTLGALQGASGLGALIGVFLLVPLAQTLKRSGLVLVGAAVWGGLMLILFSFTRTVGPAMLFMVLTNMVAPIIMTMALGLTQVMAPDNMRARLLSLFTMITFGMQPIAALISGNLAEHLGVETAVQINATLMIIGALAMLLVRTDLRRWVVNIKPAPSSVMEHV